MRDALLMVVTFKSKCAYQSRGIAPHKHERTTAICVPAFGYSCLYSFKEPQPTTTTKSIPMDTSILSTSLPFSRDLFVTYYSVVVSYFQKSLQASLPHGFCQGLPWTKYSYRSAHSVRFYLVALQKVRSPC